MEIQHNISLQAFNTFGLDAKANHFVVIRELEQLKAVLQTEEFRIKHLFLGSGSNMLLTQDFDGIVVKNELKGIQVISENQEEVIIEVQSGEIWHELVLHTISKGWGGIENLSLIPGTVGAAPIQNIGAYGVELKDCFDSLTAVDLTDGSEKQFKLEDCEFGYRMSVFKGIHKGKYFIASVRLKLQKQAKTNIRYGAISSVLEERGIESPTIKDVSDAVISIRSSKLPDPKEIGNSGSFFKNPVIPKSQFDLLAQKFENIVHYPVDENNVKVPAGWLIEQCGWKGKKVGNTGSHKDQALVLVNYGNAKGSEIHQLSKDIQKSVLDKFGIAIEAEVNIL